MTISAVYRADAVGNDTATVFPYAFKIFAAADLVVKVKKTSDGTITTLVYPTQYAVSGVGNKNGGNVTLASVSGLWQNVDGTLKTGYTIAVRRVVTVLQNTDIRNQGGFFASTHEDEFDYLTMISQQHADALTRTVTLPDAYNPASYDLNLPAPVAGSAIGWNAGANGLANVVSLLGVATTAFVLTLLDDLDANSFTQTLVASLSAEAAPDVADVLLIGDTSEGKGNKMTFADFFKVIAGLTAETAPALGDSLPFYDLSAANSRGITLENVMSLYQRSSPMGRLTLTSGLPVTTADVTAAATVYFTPYNGNIIELYDGAKWVPKTFTELSQASNDATKSPAATAASKNYDVFVWNDAGTLRATRGPTWDAGAVAGSDTARGTGAASTELELFEGRYVNKNAITNGPAARRGVYVGTIRSSAASTFNDTLGLRHVWNNFNRVTRMMEKRETTASWVYSTATLRPANNSVANAVSYVQGLSDDPVKINVQGAASNSIGGNSGIAGIGIDSTTVDSSRFRGANYFNTIILPLLSYYIGYPGIGAHTVTWLEYCNATGATTWYGLTAGADIQSGIWGELRA